LRVVPLRIPSLRERPDDIPLLAQYFLKEYWERHREPGAPIPRFSPEGMAALRARAWRGNVRELRNLIEHAVVLLPAGGDIHPEDLPSVEEGGSERSAEALSTFTDEDSYYSARERIVSRFERSYLKWLVGRATGNMSMAARIAGVDRTTLYRLMEKHSVQRDTVITIR
jgi:DNA-binding NtrC family response regulator